MNRVAVIGAGIAGIACADALDGNADVTLIEAATTLGGHTDTHHLTVDGVNASIDSGFIVFNRRNYPEFSAWLDALGVASRATDMSFSVSHGGSGLEYGTDRLAALLCQPGNALRPRFLRMLYDIGRFYRDAAALTPAQAELNIESFAAHKGYGTGFVEDHLLPMCSALWSQPAANVRATAIGHVVEFMANHGMLSLRGRPAWRVIEGGSQRYVEAFARQFHGRMLTDLPVRAVHRCSDGVELRFGNGATSLRFDAVVFACHSDQALNCLVQPTSAEQRVLGAIRYQPNRAVVHTDAALMPRCRSAWSSWNAFVTPDADTRQRQYRRRDDCRRHKATADPQPEQAPCTVTYWMNRLQRLDTPQPVFVSLNPAPKLRESHILAERHYAHPVFDRGARAAQLEVAALQGVGGVYFAGAWTGFGFHEDGFVSGRRAAAAVQQDLRRRHAA